MPAPGVTSTKAGCFRIPLTANRRDAYYTHCVMTYGSIFTKTKTTGLLTGLTSSGRFQIEVLRLNRPPLVINRQRRHLVELLLDSLTQAAEENSALEARLARQKIYINYLEARLDNPT